MKINFMPKTSLGKLSVGLIIAFFLLLAIGNLIVSLQGPVADQTFFSNPLLSIPMLSAGIVAVIAFFTGIISVIKKRERAVLAYISTIIGFFMLWFIVGEILVPH